MMHPRVGSVTKLSLLTVVAIYALTAGQSFVPDAEAVFPYDQTM